MNKIFALVKFSNERLEMAQFDLQPNGKMGTFARMVNVGDGVYITKQFSIDTQWLYANYEHLRAQGWVVPTMTQLTEWDDLADVFNRRGRLVA